jgi:hypothetical protein
VELQLLQKRQQHVNGWPAVTFAVSQFDCNSCTPDFYWYCDTELQHHVCYLTDVISAGGMIQQRLEVKCKRKRH